MNRMNQVRAGENEPWWKKTIIYQIYPRSFQDSNGDGLGDIPGIISRLDYLKSLGVETLWISPLYPGPQEDFGYDISDFTNINREYGSLDDFDSMLREIHTRGMKLVMDMVLNHTSRTHPWFTESASSLTNPRRDWYIWKEGRGSRGNRPPNNWKSQVSGSGWHRDQTTGQWYWASFLPFQPDLNWRNPEVKAEMFRILRFWLDRGVDGYRLDILGSVYEDPEFRNNPYSWKLFSRTGEDVLLFQKTVRTKNHPDNFRLAAELRTLTDSYLSSPRMLVGEVFGSPALIRRYCGETKPDGLHSVFLFKAAEIPFRTGPLRRFLAETESAFPEPFLPCLAFSNHDRTRRISVLHNNPGLYRLSFLFQMTARGIPCVYYGEETGLPQAGLSHRNSLDAVSRPFRRIPAPLFRLINSLFHGAVHRDECRTPMIWDGNRNGGFCSETAVPWLPVHEEPEKYSVEAQTGTNGSLLEFFRSLTALRSSRPALSAGTFRLIPSGKRTGGPLKRLDRGILGFIREAGDEKILVLLNPGKRAGAFELLDSDWKILFSTPGVENPDLKRRILPGGEGILLINAEFNRSSVS